VSIVCGLNASYVDIEVLNALKFQVVVLWADTVQSCEFTVFFFLENLVPDIQGRMWR
jgi:hypothetical protein